MASEDSVGSKSDIAETLQGSEETFTFECDACKLDESIKEAKYFCIDCDDYLCNDCKLYHKKVKVTRSHQIVSVKEIPIQVLRKVTKKGDTEKHDKKSLCSCNQNVVVEFCCTDHDEVFCSLCKTVHHKKCHIATIDECCTVESFVGTYEATVKKLDVLILKALALEKETEDYEETLMQMENTCEVEIKQCSKEFHLFIDRLEQNAIKDLKSKVEKLSGIHRDRKATIKGTLRLLNTDKSTQREASKKGEALHQMFIFCNKINKSLPSYEMALEDCQASMLKHEIKFERNMVLAELQNNLESIGNIASIPKCSLLDAEIQSHRVVNIQKPSNSASPWITGVAFTKNGDLLIADRRNKKIILFDSAVSSIKSFLTCPSEPRDISVIEEKEAVLALSDEKKLLFVEVSDTLKFGRVIQLEIDPYGITASHGYIYISSFRDENVLQKLDKNGNILQSISRTQIGFNCSSSYYIRTDVKGDKLYIQNGSQITCCTIAGKGLFTITDANMTEPRGLYVDSEDNTLVCGYSSNNIYIFKSDGTKHKTLLSSGHSISQPYSIAFRPVDGTLVVGDWGKGYLHVLTLSY